MPFLQFFLQYFFRLQGDGMDDYGGRKGTSSRFAPKVWNAGMAPARTISPWIK